MLQPWSDFLKMTGIMSIDSLFVFVVDVKCLNPKAINSELQKKNGLHHYKRYDAFKSC